MERITAVLGSVVDPLVYEAIADELNNATGYPAAPEATTQQLILKLSPLSDRLTRRITALREVSDEQRIALSRALDQAFTPRLSDEEPVPLAPLQLLFIRQAVFDNALRAMEALETRRAASEGPRIDTLSLTKRSPQ